VVAFDDLTEEQRRAADALDRNVTLTAGAGTGKTTTLTARYLRLLARGMGEVESVPEAGAADAATALPDDGPLLPEQILTTTFTERAANELTASVREAITDRVADADAERYEGWRTVADGLDEGYIHTLHGFCARLLREHAVTADRVDPGFETLDERETAALLDETVAGLLETEEDEVVETLARRFDRSGLQDVLTDLLTERPGGVEWAERWADATRDEYLAFVGERLHPVSPELAAARLSDPDLVAGVETLRGLLASPPAAVETGGRAWQRAEDVVDDLDGLVLAEVDATNDTRERFLAVCDRLTTGEGQRYAESTYTAAKTNWSGAEAEKERFDAAILAVVDALDPATHQFGPTLAADANGFPLVRALARLTLRCHEAYAEAKRRRNVVDFTDQVEFALAFLESAPEALRADLREQFRYVMVDEFQDTDPRQWELVKHLTAADPDDFDARNVFVVGDAKQSIYRFRNADVTQFGETAAALRAANPDESGADGEDSDGGPTGDGTDGAAPDRDDQLSTNFRTLPGVLSGLNALFDDVFETDADAPDYEARPQSLVAHRDDPASLASLEYLAVPTDADYRARRLEGPVADAAPEDDAELEGLALAARLTQLFDDAQVYDPDSGDPRSVEPEDVAILLRSRTKLKTYERALEAADVPFTVASGLGFFETPEVTALVDLLRALADPGDERALYGALRSPLFGLTDDTLARLRVDAGTGTDDAADADSLWAGLAAAEADDLRDVHQLLVDWRTAVGLASGDDPAAGLDGSWEAFLSRVVEDTGYLASVAADERGRQAVANVEKFGELLRAYAKEGVTSLPALVRRLDRQRDGDQREGEATVQGGGDGVQLLTVHDAKGTEFPVVVVPGLSRSFNTKASVGSGRVEFERVPGGGGDGGDEYAVGLKAADADDPFDDVDTVARAALRQRRSHEERAEEKRILYVACTRARDRLLLSGLHDLAGDDLASVADPTPDDASCWRDWVQPYVLTDETLAALEAADATTTRLGDATVTVSLPTPAVDRADREAPPTPSVERSPTPPRPDRRFRLSPTGVAALVDGQGSLRLDERTNTVFHESDDGEDYEEEAHAAGGRDADAPTSDGDATGDRFESVSPTVFGEAVHRLCELRPSADRRDDVIDQTLVAEGADADLTDADRATIHEHADRATAFVDDLHADHEVTATYDELRVTAEFDDGEVSGFVDHLVATPEGYHVVDYKTNDLTASEVPAKAEFYRWQLLAYAVALHQNDPDASVTATLYFTKPEEAHRFEWSSADLEANADELAGRVRRRVADVE
jgi:ATP-dependent helicase/nuclease subunit A